MDTHNISTLIVVPNWAIWLAFGMWIVSTILTITKMVLQRRTGA